MFAELNDGTTHVSDLDITGTAHLLRKKNWAQPHYPMSSNKNVDACDTNHMTTWMHIENSTEELHVRSTYCEILFVLNSRSNKISKAKESERWGCRWIRVNTLGDEILYIHYVGCDVLIC